jgi:hypothetical protein
MKTFICFSILMATNAFASNLVTHHVSVKQRFSVDRCAREIQVRTSADVVEVLTSIGIISIKSSDRDAIRVAKLSCVEAVEKNETVSGYR